MLADCEPQKEGKMKQYKRGVQYANIGIADVTVGHNDGFVEQSTQKSAANAAHATNDPIVQNAFVGHNDQSTSNALQPLAQTDEQNGIAVQKIDVPLIYANSPISCKAELYGLLKSTHTKNEILSANGTNYLMCKITVTPRAVYKTVTRALVKIKQQSCSGEKFSVMKGAETHFVNEFDPTNNLDTLTQGDITYKVFDIGHFLQDNKAQTLFFAIASLDSNSSFTATSATAISVQVQYAEEDDLAVNGAELNYSVGAKGSYSVNVRNGKLLYSHALHSAPGNLLPLNLSLNYNIGDIAIDNGWSFGYEQTLRQSGANYIYRDGAGRNHRFVQSHNVGMVYNDVTSRTGLILYPWTTSGRFPTAKPQPCALTTANGCVLSP